MSLEIKRAMIADVNTVAPLFNTYRVYYHQPTDLPAASVFLQERLEKNESVVFIATIDGEAIGFVQMYPIFSSVGLKRAWLLNDLYVDERARKQGVAKALLDRAREHGIETNAGWLMLQTGKDNLTAQSVYEKNGWKKETDFFYMLYLNS